MEMGLIIKTPKDFKKMAKYIFTDRGCPYQNDESWRCPENIMNNYVTNSYVLEQISEYYSYSSLFHYLIIIFVDIVHTRTGLLQTSGTGGKKVDTEFSHTPKFFLV